GDPGAAQAGRKGLPGFAEADEAEAGGGTGHRQGSRRAGKIYLAVVTKFSTPQQANDAVVASISSAPKMRARARGDGLGLNRARATDSRCRSRSGYSAVARDSARSSAAAGGHRRANTAHR